MLTFASRHPMSALKAVSPYLLDLASSRFITSIWLFVDPTSPLQQAQ